MLDDARTILRLALLQLDLKGGIAASGHRNLFHHLLYPLSARATDQGATRATRLPDQAFAAETVQKPIKFGPITEANSTSMRAESSQPTGFVANHCKRFMARQ
jgi:hypothetical protein